MHNNDVNTAGRTQADSSSPLTDEFLPYKKRKSDEVVAPQKENEQIGTVKEQIGTVNQQMQKNVTRELPKSVNPRKVRVKFSGNNAGKSSNKGGVSRSVAGTEEPSKVVEAPLPEKGQIVAVNEEPSKVVEALPLPPEKGQIVTVDEELQNPVSSIPLIPKDTNARKEREEFTVVETKAFYKALEANPKIRPKQMHQLPELKDRSYDTIKGKLRTYRSKGKKQGKWEELMQLHVVPALKNTEKNIEANHQRMFKEAFTKEMQSEQFQKVICKAMTKALKEGRNEEN